MKIAGIQKTSLLDYPGKIVSIIFTQGCNFHCPYCYNPELISIENEDSDYMPLKLLQGFLKKRKGLIDGLSITGGEPTIQKGLANFLIELKKNGLLIKLDTNGSNPLKLKELIDKHLVDYIAMDIKSSLPNYQLFTTDKNIAEKIKTSVGLIFNSGLDYEFRTTVVPGIHDKNTILAIAGLISGARNYYLQNFRPVNNYQKDYISKKPFAEGVLKEFRDISSPEVEKVEIRY